MAETSNVLEWYEFLFTNLKKQSKNYFRIHLIDENYIFCILVIAVFALVIVVFCLLMTDWEGLCAGWNIYSLYRIYEPNISFLLVIMCQNV